MRRRAFKPVEPDEPEDPSVDGNYNVIFKRANGTAEYGSAYRVQPGDIVEYYDGGSRTAEIKLVMGRGDKMRVRTQPMMFQGLLLRAAETLLVKCFIRVLRIRPDLQVVVDPDTMHREFVHKEPEPPKPPPPPLPEVKFAPVALPPRSSRPEPLIPLTPVAAPKLVRAVKHRDTPVVVPPVAVPKFAPVVKPTKAAKSTFPSQKVVPVVKAAPQEVKLQIRETATGYDVVGRVGRKATRISVMERETAEKVVGMFKGGGDIREVKLLVKNEKRARSARPSKPVRLVKPVTRKADTVITPPVKPDRKVKVAPVPEPVVKRRVIGPVKRAVKVAPPPPPPPPVKPGRKAKTVLEKVRGKFVEESKAEVKAARGRKPKVQPEPPPTVRKVCKKFVEESKKAAKVAAPKGKTAKVAAKQKKAEPPPAPKSRKLAAPVPVRRRASTMMSRSMQA